MKRIFIFGLIVLLTVSAGCVIKADTVPSETDLTGNSPALSPVKQSPVTAPNPPGEPTAPINHVADADDIEPGTYDLFLNKPITTWINDITIKMEISQSDGSLFLLSSGNAFSYDYRIPIAEIPAGSLVSAFYVLSSDGYPFVVVSFDYCSDDYVTKVFSFSGSEPHEIFSLPLPVSQIDEYGFNVNGYLNAVGTWDVTTSAYFVQDTVEWRGTYVLETESESYTEVTIAKDLPVTLFHDTYKASTLGPGAPISFTLTDGQSYMEFITWDGTKGSFNFEWSSDGNEMINGVSAYDYFEELPSFG